MKQSARYSEVAKRYATAIYEMAIESKAQDKYFAELKKVADLFGADKDIQAFATSPIVKAADKEAVVKKAIAGAGLSPEIESLVGLLAQRDRLSVLGEIVAAYEARDDERNGVTRGEVRSVAPLSAAQRTEIEKQVGQSTNKKVVLNYEEDKNIVGGVVAQVGSFSYDDSLASHLRRIEENLNRRMS